MLGDMAVAAGISDPLTCVDNLPSFKLSRLIGHCELELLLSHCISVAARLPLRWESQLALALSERQQL